MSEHILHPFPPVCGENSRILILGSLPSVASRENSFYYGHRQNRFWPLLARIFDEKPPASIDEKKRLLLSHGIALWDVVAECDIDNSSDSSIRNVKKNDIAALVRRFGIEKVAANGKTSGILYEELRKTPGCDFLPRATVLPSTSSANAAYTPDRLYAVRKAALTNY